MNGPFLVGIDCGTQSAKVVIVDGHGTVHALGQHPLSPMLRPRHGVVLHPNDDLWSAIVAASRQALDRFTHDPAAIAAIGLCPIRCNKAFLAGDGSLIEPMMSWMDERAYRPYLPDDPALAYVTTASGYLAHRCTGRFSDTAANNIELQWPIDPRRWDWSTDPAVLARHGVRRDQLLDLQMPGEVIGPLTAAAAAELGFAVGTPVVHTANDKAVEMLGTGALGERTALISLGTYIASMVHGAEYHASPINFWTNFSAVPHRYLYESGGIRRGMWTLTWFLDLLGPELADRARVEGVSREDLLEREALDTPAGSDGLLTVLDWLAPDDKPFRKGVMLGFDARHTHGHLYRSIMEAIALTMHHHVTAMCDELGITLESIVLSGGGAASTLFRQIFADVFGLPAQRPTGASGASLGSAICAAVAAGVHPDFASAVDAMCSPRESLQPDVRNAERYAGAAAVLADVRAATDPLLERAYPLFH